MAAGKPVSLLLVCWALSGGGLCARAEEIEPSIFYPDDPREVHDDAEPIPVIADEKLPPLLYPPGYPQEVLEYAEQVRAKAKEIYGEKKLKDFPQDYRQFEAGLLYPLLQAGFPHDLSLKIMGTPNNEDGYHLKMYKIRLVFKEGTLVDDIRGLYKRAGSTDTYPHKVRALQRLAELRVFDIKDLLDGRDTGIDTARALGLLCDRRAVPVLVHAARRGAFEVDGSESATIHGIYQCTLAATLSRLTGLSLKWPDMMPGWDTQNSKGLRAAEDKSKAWWVDHKTEITGADYLKRGIPVEGLALELKADRDAYAVGDEPSLTVAVVNTSDKPAKVCRHASFFTRYYTDDRGGEVLKRPRFLALKQRLGRDPDYALCEVKPGGRLELPLGQRDRVVEDGGPSDWEVKQAPERAGRYRVRVHYIGVRYVGALEDAKLDGNWEGVLTSNTIDLTFK